MNKKDLRPHQVESVDAIVRGFDVPPGGIPVNGLRGQLVSACGTGKTITAAFAAREMLPRGRILVLVPTLDLLAQTVKEWARVGHRGPAVAVCSMQDDPELWAMGVRSTTNPLQLALWHGSGPVTIYATYASLGTLKEAFQGGYGQQLAPVDLAVVDEAHRTSGSMGKAWTDIHDQTAIPAWRRLYLTATPRIWQERPRGWELAEGTRDPLPEELAASMDDESIFGPVFHKLSLASAVSRELLARYQIIVMEVRDPVVTPERLMGEERRSEEVRGQRLGALQAALLHTMAQHGLQTCITYHHRTMEAQAFAEGLERVARRMYGDRPDRYPAGVWADWLCGEHAAERRREVMAEFGATGRRAVLSNCRVLGEGVDIRAVDSVALMDPKGAPHDIVQAIGRALRQKPGERKLASLIVPVFLQPGEVAEDMFTSESYRPLVRVLEGLRAHDEEAVEMLAIPQVNGTEAVDPSYSIGVEPEDGEEESRLLLRFSAPRDPSMVADWVSFNVIDTERQDWARNWSKLKAFVEREGHARVPYSHREQGAPLGAWVSSQRRIYLSGRMPSARAARLERLGMVWTPEDEQFQENLAAARVWAEEHWTLCAPRSATVLDRPVGQWLSNLRRPGVLEGRPKWEQALREVDEHWNPDWPVAWQRTYAALRALVEEEDGVDVVPGVTIHGMDVGRWLARQRQHEVWQGLMEGQRKLLEEIGVAPEAPQEAIAPVEGEPAVQDGSARARKGSLSAFERGVAALGQYAARTGSVTVSRAYVETIEVDGQEYEVRLGVWLSNTKSRRAKLTADQRAELAGLGLEWAAGTIGGRAS
ncbi:Helicase associated domain protein [Streptomyces diastaticus]|uniref:DEAD/DEAH box helicase n=1 Tax=Streptomyces TaxID=1883 RepID=UPI000C259782|nr:MULTISPECIES: DEAD/DEAH box helicase [unclassified Streptomyces]MBL3808416.1 Helicase associated domain protein [Streptomyces sp. BRB081]PJM80541.1 helicase [Streptomyces sp. TSRI0384-2]